MAWFGAISFGLCLLLKGTLISARQNFQPPYLSAIKRSLAVALGGTGQISSPDRLRILLTNSTSSSFSATTISIAVSSDFSVLLTGSGLA